MNLDSLHVFLHPDTFQPFDLKLANGDVHRITDAYQMAVTKTQAVVLNRESGLWVHCTPHQVVSVERVVAENVVVENGDAASLGVSLTPSE